MTKCMSQSHLKMNHTLTLDMGGAVLARKVAVPSKNESHSDYAALTAFFDALRRSPI